MKKKINKKILNFYYIYTFLNLIKMNSIKFQKFLNSFYKIFPKKDEKYIIYNNIQYIVSLKNLNNKKVELSFLNPETLMKYQKILTFSEILELNLCEQNFINNNHILYDDILNALFDKINIDKKTNKTKFKIFENKDKNSIRFNFFFEKTDINSDIILENVKIEHEDIYSILIKEIVILIPKVTLLQREVNSLLEKKSQFDLYTMNRKLDFKMKDLTKKINNMELEIQEIKSFNQNFIHYQLEEISNINTGNSIAKVDIFPNSKQIISIGDNIYFWKNYKQQSPITKSRDFFNCLSIKDENHFVTSKDSSIQIWEYDINKSKIKKEKIFKYKEIIFGRVNRFFDDFKLEENDKIIDIFYRKKIKNPSIIVILLSGDIQLIEYKDNEFKCLSHIYNEKITLLHDTIQYNYTKLNGGYLLEDKNILIGISNTEDGTIFWDLKNNYKLFNIKEAKCNCKNAICALNDDKIILGGGNKKKDRIKIISISKQKIIHTIDGIENECTAIYCLRKENLFLIAHNNKIILYDIENYNQINIIDYNTKINGFIEVNNENFISYNFDGNIIVWKISNSIDF